MALVREQGRRDLSRWEDPLANEPESNPMSWHRVLWVGYGVVFLFFGAFGVWAALAPLGSGAIAQGQVQVAGEQRVVQHLEGGIIREIRVKEGDLVRDGQPLMVLDTTQSKVLVGRLDQQYLAALGREARLIAESDGSSAMRLPEELSRRVSDPAVESIIEGERRLFDGRRRALDSQISLLERRIEKSRQEIAAYLAQKRADRRQLEIIQEEISGVRELFEKGLERKPRLLALQRTQAELEGSIDNRTALMARGEQAIAEIEFQLLGLLEQTTAEIETELREIQNTVEDLREQLIAASDAMARSVITAPHSGRIYGLRFHTAGGVVAPGEPILNIVPEDEELIVHARLDPADIDVVAVGALAIVRLTSFSQRTTKPINGEVLQISADVITPENGPPFYEARIRLDKEMLARHNLNLVPGMPAMAIISTGEQTLLDYLVSPITRSLETALKEQ
ncbi:MAG: HlyD family type I secretion periplasmic adaptor subunit [Alphaproteobacteria bacterium]|nr:HlyD family type I secretion periplasmic adaptor subunit [Alphaproteobacteria bacterium]